MSSDLILQIVIFCGVISVIYGFVSSKQILSASAGDDKMQEIASAIQIGAKAYLNRQYTTIAIVGVIVLILISFLFSIWVGLGICNWSHTIWSGWIRRDVNISSSKCKNS